MLFPGFCFLIVILVDFISVFVLSDSFFLFFASLAFVWWRCFEFGRLLDCFTARCHHGCLLFIIIHHSFSSIRVCSLRKLIMFSPCIPCHMVQSRH